MTSLHTAADRFLGRSRMVVPELPGGPDLLGHDDRDYGQVADWWWVDDRRLVLPVDTGVLVATDPREVGRRPLRLVGCARLLLVDAGAGGAHEVREAHDAELVLRRSRGRGLLGGHRSPDPGTVPADLHERVGQRVTAQVDGEDAPAPLAGTLLAAAVTPSSHLVLVVAPRLVVVLRGEVEVESDGATLRLQGGDGRVTWVPDDGAARAVRPGTLVLGTRA